MIKELLNEKNKLQCQLTKMSVLHGDNIVYDEPGLAEVLNGREHMKEEDRTS